MSVISKSNPVQLQQIKYFVSCVDTLVGQAIVEQVRNDHLNDINPHIIIGTKSSKNIGPVPQSVKRIINSSDPGTLTKALIDSDVIIYDLNSAKLDEVEYAIKVLRMSNFESEKTLILISSVMVWSNTPPKEKKDGDEEDESVAHEEGEDPSFNAGIPSIAYREKDYARRRPSPKYEIFKTLETQCLGAGNIKKNLSTYVLCSGILYGNGEETFAEYFKQAWLQNPEALSYIGEGRNIIPTIHVKDLAMYVNFVVLKRPATRYIFAIDHGKNQTLKNIVQAISSGLGTGKVKSVSVLQAINDPYLEVFKLNIKLCPSNVVELQEGEEDHGLEEIDETDEEVERLTAPRFRFTWWCKDGLKKNIEKVVNEYNTYRGLKQVRIFMVGPPAGGKTYFGTRLSQIYNVPHLLIAEAVREVQEMQNDFGNEIRTLLAEMKAQMVAEAEAQLEELKKKKKKGQPDPVVDPDKIIPRLPDHLLLKVYKYVLEKNDCYNRGFVLDGFPKTYEQAKTLFTVPAAPKEGEEAAGEQAQAIELDPRKVPEFVIKFEAHDDFLKARVKGLPEDQVAGTHYNEEGMVRRLAGYTKLHTADGINPVLMSFFEEHGIDVLKVKYENNVTNEQLLETMKQFIEKNGKFKNFQDAELIEELRRKRKQREEQEIEAKKQEELRKQQEEKEKKEKQLHEEEARKKLEGIKENEKKLLDERSQPLRQYLADMVVPTLTTGLIEICKEKPNDPVEFLIEYLMKKSAEVIKPPETTTQK